MHLSHITEDLEAWYLNFDFDERVLTAFRPGLTDVKQGAQTVAAGAEGRLDRARSSTRQFKRDRPLRAQRVDPDDVAAAAATSSAPTAPSIRRARRSRSAPTSTRSTTRSRSRRDPERDQLSREPAAGVHFVVFNPSGDDFERNRLAMDGVLPDGTKLDARRRARARRASTPCSTTTHRQNFLVPPRRHRSFPLAEL